jgi:hypothetical protein
MPRYPPQVLKFPNNYPWAEISQVCLLYLSGLFYIPYWNQKRGSRVKLQNLRLLTISKSLFLLGVWQQFWNRKLLFSWIGLLIAWMNVHYTIMMTICTMGIISWWRKQSIPHPFSSPPFWNTIRCWMGNNITQLYSLRSSYYYCIMHIHPGIFNWHGSGTFHIGTKKEAQGLNCRTCVCSQ